MMCQKQKIIQLIYSDCYVNPVLPKNMQWTGNIKYLKHF